MTDDVQRAQWGNLEGQSWAGLARLSTEEIEGDNLADESSDGRRFVPMTGRDIKSTEEQEKDGRRFVESRGGRYVYTYMEPDTSAWKRRRIRLPDGRTAYRVIRPVFEGALEDLKRGSAPNGDRMDGLIVYDIDRLTRDPRHLEDAIEVVEHHHRPIIDITGTLDLLTDNGRAMARVLVTMANKQSADTARRVRRKHKVLREKGIPVGGSRPFGWQEDKRTLRPEEARLLRDAARRLIEGATWHSIIAEWNREGITTTRGNRWTRAALREVMRNPRLCGHRSYTVSEIDPETGRETRHIAIAQDDEGKPVIGQWQSILTVAEWQAVVAIIGEGPIRGTGHNTRTYLGTGTLRCGKEGCGALLRALKAARSQGKPDGYFYYGCHGKATGRGCGGIKIGGPETDELIAKLVIAKYEEEAATREATMAPQAWPKEAELANVREDITDLKQARRNRQILPPKVSVAGDVPTYSAHQEKRASCRTAIAVCERLQEPGEPVHGVRPARDPYDPAPVLVRRGDRPHLRQLKPRAQQRTVQPVSSLPRTAPARHVVNTGHPQTRVHARHGVQSIAKPVLTRASHLCSPQPCLR